MKFRRIVKMFILQYKKNNTTLETNKNAGHQKPHNINKLKKHITHIVGTKHINRNTENRNKQPQDIAKHITNSKTKRTCK